MEIRYNMSFDTLGLRAELLRAVKDAGYVTPTPVQSQAIPVVLDGRDMLAGAQTGTGKTAAFVLPILQRLTTTAPPQRGRRRPIRALIVTPTRELAAQIEAAIRLLGRHSPVRTAAIFGGVSMRPQLDALMRGIDILVATPGRLLDHANQGTLDLRGIEVVVLDEADRMLDMGFLPDVRRILALAPASRQTLMFSATFPFEIRSLAESMLRSPEFVEVERKTMESDLVEHSIYSSPRDRKPDVLSDLLTTGAIDQALVFTRTRHGADRLARRLQRDGIAADAIHGSLTQNQRTRALAAFRSRSSRVLVATDIASRGLDIEQLPHVVNFELPLTPEDYVHRIGRTGRAGLAGQAISLVSPDEMPALRSIERLLGKRIPVAGGSYRR